MTKPGMELYMRGVQSFSDLRIRSEKEAFALLVRDEWAVSGLVEIKKFGLLHDIQTKLRDLWVAIPELDDGRMREVAFRGLDSISSEALKRLKGREGLRLTVSREGESVDHFFQPELSEDELYRERSKPKAYVAYDHHNGLKVVRGAHYARRHNTQLSDHGAKSRRSLDFEIDNDWEGLTVPWPQ